MSFHRSILPAERIYVARSAERSPLHSEVEMRRAGYRGFRVRIFDASPEGCKVEFIERPTLDERIWIKFDGIDGLVGTVRWVDEHRCGVHFNHAVHGAVFQRILEHAARSEQGGGAVDPMRPVEAVLNPDQDDSAQLYSTCEWWLEPRTLDCKERVHAEDHAYYVIEGTLNLHMNDEWLQLSGGSYVIVPGGTIHEFANETTERVGFLTFKLPGGAEA